MPKTEVLSDENVTPLQSTHQITDDEILKEFRKCGITWGDTGTFLCDARIVMARAIAADRKTRGEIIAAASRKTAISGSERDPYILDSDEQGALRNALMKSVKIVHPSPAPSASFQSRVLPWLLECFGQEIADNAVERNHRFLEESLELVQACGCTQSEAHQLVDYVFGREIGEKKQECGGVMVTLAALCLAQKIDMHECGEIELARVWTMVEKIRAKQAAKPKHSPLPEHAPSAEKSSAASVVEPMAKGENNEN